MNSSHTIRKAVIPAAGLGTRFLPATKSVPKEMLPVAARPLIQFAVEEAATSGLEAVIFVLARGRTLVAEHFQRNTALENVLLQRGKDADAEMLRQLSNLVDIYTVWQDSPLGLAHAISCAHSYVGEEPFAVILPDALIDSPIPCTRQLMDFYSKYPGCVLATQQVQPSEVERYGILEVVPMPDSSFASRALCVNSLIERPSAGSVSWRYGIFGRYILRPEIFRCIEDTRPGYGGELQLTDSLALCSKQVPVYAYEFEGKHYDAGSKLGFLKATVAYALKDPEIAQSLREQPGSLDF